MAELGTTYKDKITGFKGVATAYCEYITGCNQILLCPKVGKDGVSKDSRWFDEQRCVQMKVAKVHIENGDNPGFGEEAPKR